MTATQRFYLLDSLGWYLRQYFSGYPLISASDDSDAFLRVLAKETARDIDLGRGASLIALQAVECIQNKKSEMKMFLALYMLILLILLEDETGANNREGMAMIDKEIRCWLDQIGEQVDCVSGALGCISRVADKMIGSGLSELALSKTTKAKAEIKEGLRQIIQGIQDLRLVLGEFNEEIK